MVAPFLQLKRSCSEIRIRGVCFASKRNSIFKMRNEKEIKRNEEKKIEAIHIRFVSMSVFVSKFIFLFTFFFIIMFNFVNVHLTCSNIMLMQHIRASYSCSMNMQHGYAAQT